MFLMFAFVSLHRASLLKFFAIVSLLLIVDLHCTSHELRLNFQVTLNLFHVYISCVSH